MAISSTFSESYCLRFISGSTAEGINTKGQLLSFPNAKIRETNKMDDFWKSFSILGFSINLGDC